MGIFKICFMAFGSTLTGVIKGAPDARRVQPGDEKAASKASGI